MIKNRTRKISIGCIFAAFVAAFAVYIVMLQTQRNMLVSYEKINAYAASTDISRGEIINNDNIENFVTPIEIDKNLLTESMITGERLNLLQGEFVCGTDIEAGSILSTSWLIPVEEATKNMDNPVIAGFRVEDLYQAVGGILRSGDRINIYRVDDDGAVCLCWRQLFVMQVFDNNGNTIANSDVRTAAQRVNVFLDEKDVEKFYTEIETGAIRVVKLCGEE